MNPNANLPVMVAPKSTGKQRNENVRLIETGNHIARLYGIVDIGSQLNTNYGTHQRKIMLLFEFPHHYETYYIGEQPMIATISAELTFSVSSKANLRKFIHGMLGKNLTDSEADTFNIFQLLDEYYVVQVQHVPGKKDSSKIYERIVSVFKYDPRFKVEGVDYKKDHASLGYHLDTHGFTTAHFASIPFWIRKKLISSLEGQNHASSGGTFAEPPKDNVSQNQTGYAGPEAPQSHNPNIPVPGQQIADPQKKLVWLNKDQYTYEQLKASGWTDKLLVQNGYAKWEQVSGQAPTPPAPSAGNVAPPPSMSPSGLQPPNVSGDESNGDLPF